MIFFFENGQLGNQLFQYQGIKNYFPKHKLYFFGFYFFRKMFDNINVKFLFKNKIIISFLKFVFFFLAKIRVIGTINEQIFEKFVPSSNFKIIIQKGIFRKIFLAQRIYFQDKKCVNKFDNKLCLKREILLKAQYWLKKKNIFQKSNLIFVHIRRGDFLSWPDPKYSASLDLAWYLKSMSYLKNKFKSPIFILMSDDYLFLKKNFKNSKNLIICNESVEISFAIMTMCSHGILSASTFSWWATYFIKTRNLDKKESFLIAPKFWAGHRIKKWLPYKNFIFHWLSYR
jgi:hypothetical protein